MIKFKIKIKRLNFYLKKVESQTKDNVQDLHQYAQDELILDKVTADVVAVEFAFISKNRAAFIKGGQRSCHQYQIIFVQVNIFNSIFLDKLMFYSFK